ncbi:MAG: NAD(P)H-hydrate epimerase [Candidatus Lokiarchaeota archaeon]|nr:NAD(P)H-hydrate epimerase [Candidatus Lokiarchaeota archaeon]
MHLTTPLTELEFPFQVDLILDAIIGYSLKGEPEGNAAILIKSANKAQAPIVSLDIPSGMDASSGETYGDLTIKATATMTLGFPKTGFQNLETKYYTGSLFLSDISVPVKLCEDLELGSIRKGIFRRGSIIKIR